MVGRFFVVHIDWRYEMPIILTSLQSLDRIVDHVMCVHLSEEEEEENQQITEGGSKDDMLHRQNTNDGHTFDNDDFSIKMRPWFRSVMEMAPMWFRLSSAGMIVAVFLLQFKRRCMPPRPFFIYSLPFNWMIRSVNCFHSWKDRESTHSAWKRIAILHKSKFRRLRFVLLLLKWIDKMSIFHNWRKSKQEIQSTMLTSQIFSLKKSLSRTKKTTPNEQTRTVRLPPNPVLFYAVPNFHFRKYYAFALMKFMHFGCLFFFFIFASI